ncbi:MAG: MFS transporter [Alphaproteobacteria bacterium]|nr:MFS transporter [Alphaproteobacteria bacterium]
MSEAPDSVVPVPPEEPPSKTTAAGMTRAPSALALLKVFRHRNYRLFFAGQLVSLMGTWITSVAQGWLVYRLSHSPFQLGLVAFAGQVPVFFVASFGGMIADRVDRRRLLVVTQTLSMLESLALAVLTLLGVIRVWEIVLLALFQGTVNAFDIPTRQAFTIDMVGRQDLRYAISLNSMMFNLARILGPTVAGLLIAAAGEGVCFSIDAASYGAVLVGLLLMAVPRHASRTTGRPLQEIKDGFSYTWNSPPIRNPLLLVAACAAFGVSFMSLMPAVARDVLHEGSEGLGFLMASVGVGALFGAYALARVPDRYLTLAPAAAAAGFGLSIILFAHSHWLLLSMGLLLPAAFGQMLLGGSTNTIIQTLSEDRFRGRVIAFYTMSFMGMMPWGALALGWLASRIGISEAVTLGGSICVIAAVTAYYAGGHPRLRHGHAVGK